jgi:riboflavin kinase/FMN adenylyltransferase
MLTSGAPSRTVDVETIFGIDRLTRRLVNPVVTLGNFDGIHLGHQKILERVKTEASRIGGESVVITFEPHPLKVLSPESCLTLLTPFRRKILLIEQSGMDVLLCIEFTKTFSEMSPSDFVKNILIEKVGAQKVIVGFNYHFGKNKKGNPQILKQIGSLFNLQVEIIDSLIIEETTVSSSKIRELIKNGQVEKASKLLGRHYSILGKVIEGAKRGHLLGFPTANLEISEELTPLPGVYAVEVLWKRQSFKGVANVGWNPTFQTEGEGKISSEVYILDFNEDIYGEEIQIDFVRRIRDEARFDSIAQLITQIQKDIEWAQENVFKNKAPS